MGTKGYSIVGGSGGGGGSAAIDETEIVLVDDFTSGTGSDDDADTNGTIGALNWWLGRNSGDPQGYANALGNDAYGGIDDRPGVLEIGCGTGLPGPGNWSQVALHLQAYLGGYNRSFDISTLTSGVAWRARFFARLYQADTDTAAAIGIGGPSGGIHTQGNNAVGVWKDVADTNWQLNDKNTTFTDSGIAVDTDWHRFEVYTKSPNTTLGVSIGGVEIGDVDLTGTDLFGPVFFIASQADSKLMLIDRFDFRMTGLTAR